MLTQHDIARLDIQVIDAPCMNISKGICHFLDVCHSCCFRQCALTLHHLRQILPLDILHHIVCSIILFKDVMNLNNVGMVKLRNGTCLLQELLAKTHHRFPIALCAQCHMARTLFAVAIFLIEELLDGDLPSQHYLFSQVGDTKASLTKCADYSIFTTLKSGLWL